MDMVTKEILTQYSDLLKEKEEVRNKIAYLEDRIPKLEEKIKKTQKLSLFAFFFVILPTQIRLKI